MKLNSDPQSQLGLQHLGTSRKPRARIFEESLPGAKREESGEGRKRRTFGGVGGCVPPSTQVVGLVAFYIKSLV